MSDDARVDTEHLGPELAGEKGEKEHPAHGASDGRIQLKSAAQDHLAEMGDAVVPHFPLPDHVVQLQVAQVRLGGLGHLEQLLPAHVGILAHVGEDRQLMMGDGFGHAWLPEAVHPHSRASSPKK